MQDQLLTCENCGNPFVYSVYEQTRDNKKISDNSQQSTIHDLPSTQPKYCPICTSIKASESKHPAKPPKVLRSPKA